MNSTYFSGHATKAASSRGPHSSSPWRFLPTAALILLVFVSLVFSTCAHEVRPAFLELTERAPGEFDVLWKVPALGGVPLAGEDLPHDQPAADADQTAVAPCGCQIRLAAAKSFGVLPIHPSLPPDAQVLVPPRVERLTGAELRRWKIRVGAKGLEGWEVSVHGLSATMVDVLVRIAFADGRVVSRMLRPDAPSFVFTSQHAGPGSSGYFRLGIEHILLGVDHLLFVLCLLLLVRGWGPIWKTVTAFTAAHSVTLGLATLGYVHVPLAPVEAAIALSIIFLAMEVVRARPGSLTLRQPWLVAFAFGLLHGFGFAGALSEVGLPANDIPLALLLFNLGVEAGQLLFVAAVLPLVLIARRLAGTPVARLRPAPAYAIGVVASYWLIARVAAFW